MYAAFLAKASKGIGNMKAERLFDPFLALAQKPASCFIYLLYINSFLYSTVYSVALYNWNNSNRTKLGSNRHRGRKALLASLQSIGIDTQG